MAFSAGGSSGGGGRRSRFRGTTSLAEINIVPLVDVVLVLLIIFMLTAHVMEFGLEVEVPKVKPAREEVQNFPVIEMDKEGGTFLNGKPININSMATTIRQRYKDAKAVYLRADRRTTWDPIAQVIATLGEAKLGVNVVTQPKEMTGKNRK
jgi:biopolymer transport protein ExbD